MTANSSKAIDANEWLADYIARLQATINRRRCPEDEPDQPEEITLQAPELIFPKKTNDDDRSAHIFSHVIYLTPNLSPTRLVYGRPLGTG
jgi:hypothetical protein